METSLFLFIDALRFSDHAQAPLTGEISAVKAVEQAAAVLNESYQTRTFLLTCADDPGSLAAHSYFANAKKLELADRSQQSVVTAIAGQLEGADRHDTVMLILADAPFLLLAETEKLLAQHRRYYCHYSFADGFPRFCTPELVSVEAMPMLLGTASAEEEFDVLFSIIQKDINAYDIETMISPKDYRLERLELRADNARNLLLCQRLAEGLDAFLPQTGQSLLSANELIRVLDAAPQTFRTLPASINWILHAKSSTPAIYYPEMPDYPVADMKAMCEAVEKIVQWSGDCVVSLSHLGEPAEYPRIYELLDRLVQIDNVKVVIETQGFGWDMEKMQRLCLEKADQISKIEWIVFIDANDERLYQEIRPGGSLPATLAAIDVLEGLFPKRVHVQAVRMDISEDHLLDFYQAWKKKTDRIIIQKYNNYGGRLTDRRVSDTAPIVRNACWRLRRELSILPDGTVPMCHVDIIEPAALYGSILKDAADTIWADLNRVYHQHLDDQLPAICVGCDEYFTFTF